jgi:hypothetical protein
MHGLAQFSESIFASLELDGAVDHLGLGASPAGRECFLLIDGMGLELLRKYSRAYPVFTDLIAQGELASHFPSTTAVNISSVGTGVMPGIHGMLGYTVRVPRSGTPGRILNSLKWDDRVDPVMWQRTPTLFERATAQGISVSHIAAKRYEGTGFTQAALRGALYVGANIIPDIIAGAKRALTASPSYAYLYLNNLDHAGHESGVGSPEWLAALGVVAELIEGLIAQLPPGTRLWVSADHGMINVGEKIVVGEGNRLLEKVSLMAGEPRARHIYVDEQDRSYVQDIWRETLDTRATIYTRAEAIAADLFGTVVTHDSEDRMGDLIAIAHDEVILIDPARVKEESSMVGHHGGITREELSIPMLSRTIE